MSSQLNRTNCIRLIVSKAMNACSDLEWTSGSESTRLNARNIERRSQFVSSRRQLRLNYWWSIHCIKTILLVEMYMIFRLNQRTPTYTPTAIWAIQRLQWTFLIIKTIASLQITKKSTEKQDANENEWKWQEYSIKQLNKFLGLRASKKSTNTEMCVVLFESLNDDIQ